MDEFKVGQLTKELVAIKLKQMADPCAAAAKLVKETLSVALRGLKPGEAGSGVVEEACQGGVTALVLAEQNLSRGAILILEAVVEISSELNLDQTALMHSALRGIANVRRVLRPEQLDDIQREICLHFMGTGEVFAALLREEPKGGLQTKSPE